MRAFLAPYLWPLFGALCAALVGAVGYIYVQGLWMDQAEAEWDALDRRVQALETVKGLRNEAANDDDDDLADSISDVQPGGR